MKKNFLVVLMLVLFSTFCLTACNLGSSIEGKFKQSEYVISLDEVIDFSDELVVKGVEKDKIVFSSSNQDILAKTEEGFCGLNSGKAVIFAEFENKVIAKSQVYVKHKLNAPQNIYVDDNSGIVSFDASFVIIDGTRIEASGYDISLNLMGSAEKIEFKAEQNSFKLNEVGSYQVRIIASSTNQRIDSSEEKQYILNYGVMSWGEGEFNFATNKKFDQKVTVSWPEFENAIFDVYVDGIQMASNLTSSSFEIDLQRYEGNKEISFEVIIKDRENVKLPASKVTSITVLPEPVIGYDFSENLGNIKSDYPYNAIGFLLEVKNLETGKIEYKYIEKTDDIFIDNIIGIEKGIYEIRQIAVGGNKNGKFYANSKVSNIVKIGKLDMPDVDVKFVDEKIQLNFAVDDYVTKYKISYDNDSLIFDTDINGQKCELDFSTKKEGNYNLHIIALPSLDGTRVKELEIGGYTSGNVVNSDDFMFNFYKLNAIGSVKHSMTSSSSYFEFDKIENANAYQVYLDNKLIGNDYSYSNDKIVVRVDLDSIKKISPNDGVYNFEIVALYVENDLQHSFKSSITKQLEILEIVSESDNQVNGSFMWNDVGSGCGYYYEIYKTDKNFQDNSQNAFITNETLSNSISEILEEGYYKIKITTLSKDLDNFLDSDFYDSNNVFVKDFFVTKKIQAPKIKIDQTNQLSLIISSVEFGGEYQVYIDGKLDGSVVISQMVDEVVYKFNDALSQAKDYQISVIAGGGKLFDNEIYLNSEPSEIVVTRLAEPEFEVADVYSKLEELLGQKLEVERMEGSRGVYFSLNGEYLLESESFTLDMFDKNIFGSEFNLGITLLSQEANEKHFYINSIEKVVSFNRVHTPTTIDYNEGYIFWQNDDNRVQDYYFSLILKNANSDYYYRFQTSTLDNRLNLQSNIDALCKNSIEFLTAYRLAEKVEVEMIAYRNGYEGNVYLLPSFDGSKKEIYHLEKVNLTFDADKKVISWNSDIPGSTFDIYIDDETVPFEADYRKNEYDITNMLSTFAKQRKITVLAKNTKYLSSEKSEGINIKRLDKPNSISIEKIGEEYFVSFVIKTDSAFVREVQVNGSSSNVDYNQGSNRARFNPSLFVENSYSIKLIAKNESEKNFYIDSEEVVYTLIDLSTEEFSASIMRENVVWTEVAEDMIGNNINPVVYEISVTSEGKTDIITLVQVSSISLQLIEEMLGIKLKGDVRISIKAIVDKTYSILFSEDCLGYYGQSEEIVMSTQKLKSLTELDYTIEEADVINKIERKTSSSLKLTFADIWSNLDKIQFAVSIIGNSNKYENKYEFSPVLDKNSDNYKFNLVDGKYQLIIQSSLLSQFGGGDLKILIKVEREEYFSSDNGEINLSRLNLVSNVEIDDKGFLTINDDQNANYMLEINVGDEVVEVDLKKDKVLNLLTDQLLKNRKGAFTVKVIAYDENNITLSSQKSMHFSGYKLEGIENVEIDEEGYVNLTLFNDDFNDLIFVATKNGNEIEFIPQQENLTTNKFKVALIELLKMFEEDLSVEDENANIEFSVKKKGSIKASVFVLNFKFAIESEQPILISNYQNEKDYILFDLLENSVETLTFRFSVKAQNMIEGIDEKEFVKIIPAEDILGYWQTDQEGRSEFSLLPQIQGGISSTEKYALDLSVLLSEVDFGRVEIEVSRIVRSDLMIQYNLSKFVINKLNSINNDQTLHVSNNHLNFSWQSKDGTSVANSFMVYFEREGKEFKLNTAVSSVDLRDIGLVSGQTYNIYIIAINNDKNIISSNRSSAVCQTIQFTKPTTLEVKNGILQFNQDVFENSRFIADMNDYFGQANPTHVYHEEMGEREYKDIFYFTPGYLERFEISLLFNRVEDGKLTNKIYTMTTKGYNLFPDLKLAVKNSDYTQYLNGEDSMSYFNLLNIYSTKNLQGNEAVKAVNVKLMIEALSKSSKGIGDGGYLFDDSGRDIPAGEYFVSIKENGYQQFVQSIDSDGVRMYLSSAPKVDLLAEEIDGKINYFASVQLSNTMLMTENGYEESIAKRYKLQLRKNGEIATNASSTIDFLIEFDEVGKNWMLSFNDILLEGVINITQAGESEKLRINMTQLRYKLQELGQDVIAINELYRADIFAYNQDNGFVINGKSGIFNVRYLDLRAEDIHFENGKFIVETNSEGFELLVRSKKPSVESQARTVKFANGRAVIDLRETGTYEYVVLSLNGSHSNSELNIESSSYKILDVYKLSAPSLKITNGSISIVYNQNDALVSGSLRFNMGNNISLDEGYQENDKGYYYQSLIMSNEKLPLYRPGSTDKNGDVMFKSELEAEAFYAYLSGNNGNFVVSENADMTSDYILVFATGEKPLLSSSETVISARMLEEVDNVDIYKGDIRISDDSQIQIFDINNQEAKVLYEIKIEYYYKDNTNQDKLIFAYDEIIYSEKSVENEVVMQYISGKNISANYLYYKFDITLVPARKVDNDDVGEKLTTIEGNLFRLSDALSFEDGCYALRSASVSVDRIVSRTKSAFLASRNNGIYNGNINFIVDKSVYYSSNPENIANDTANRIAIYANYTAQGKEKTVLLSGKYTFATSTVSGEENNVYVSFMPDDGQINDAVKAVKIKIYVYGIDDEGQNALLSTPLEISDVYKLPKIDKKYYSIILSEGNTAIDFSKYFSSVAILDNHDCYKLVINFTTDEGAQTIDISNNSTSKVFVLPENISTLSFQAQDAQTAQEVNIKKLLFSDKENLDVDTTSIETLEISYNEELMRFEWQWPEDNTNRYEYFVNLYISSSQETMFTTENFYCPRNTGTIYPNTFRLKARKLSEDESSISVFSKEKAFVSDDNIECRPFTGGNGSLSNPYQIANARDFSNIRLRNTNDFYFKLISNIEINSADNLMGQEEFNGHLNGDGYKITFTSSTDYQMDEISQYLIGLENNLSFEAYSSIFKSVSKVAQVKNISFSYNINFTSIDASKILFAPVCLFNYGNIENVNLTEFNIYLDGDRTSVGNNIFVGGIATFNYGNIQNCKNTAGFDYVMPQALSFNFGFAGIALFNSNKDGNIGTISNCFNSGDKKINVATSNNNFYMAGISLSNIGKISICGNDANLTIATRTTSVTSINCYFAGITVTSTNATLEYLYNNGKISVDSARANFVYSGIVYQIIGGSINTLVDTQSQPITRSCQLNTIDYGNHYASNNSGTTINVQVKELTEIELTCSQNQNLVIKKTEDGYKASIRNK